MPVVNLGKKSNKELGDLCKFFNKNKSYDMFVKLIEMNPNYSDRNMCRICGGELYYKNITFKGPFQTYPTFFGGTTPYSSKNINGNVYNLSVCEKCMKEKFPEWDSLNASRVFNRPNKYTQYAFNVSDDVIEKKKNELCARTFETFIKKYGEDEGSRRWEEYKKKQSYTNSFEYKHLKYGMTEDEFRDYNLNRATTFENFVKRYGYELACKKWDTYIKRQSYTTSKDYFIKTYGEEDGEKKWLNFQEKRSSVGPYSPISQEFFRNLLEFNIFDGHNVYFAELNYEYEILTQDKKVYYLDFYDANFNICVEFNGLAFHPKPGKYNDNDFFSSPFDKEKTLVSDIWKREQERYDTLLKEFGIHTIVVWEDDYKENKKNCVCSIINEIIKYGKN